MKDKYETVFLYDKDIDDYHFDSVISILKISKCKVLKFDDTIDLTLRVSSEEENRHLA
ncbi:hypothetical protein [Clostridium folliculivorans]|uniref:hypothetical protein n=1 Tax=Clostridium folliculivorans TaxID=2886038 RepID=UPI0021C341CC|nr:hypothetical protein [Clostridium folliculivorans]GKU30430.1 hypothetical protein CFB3_25370 [Clostridium folliculivorans]